VASSFAVTEPVRFFLMGHAAGQSDQ